jgi:hypothetical protein
MEQLPKPKLAWLALPVLAGISALLIAYGPGVIYEAVTGEPPKDFDQPVDPGYRHLGTDKQLAEEIDALFESFAVGKWPASSGKRILADGWIMKWPGNGTIHRAILREFAEPIIAHGPKAVPIYFAGFVIITARYATLPPIPWRELPTSIRSCSILPVDTKTPIRNTLSAYGRNGGWRTGRAVKKCGSRRARRERRENQREKVAAAFLRGLGALRVDLCFCLSLRSLRALREPKTSRSVAPSRCRDGEVPRSLRGWMA